MRYDADRIGDLFAPHTLARADDPATSHAAAARVREFGDHHHALILGVLRQFPRGLTAHEIAAFAEPLAGLLEQKVEEGTKELQCIKTTLLASMQGYAPQVAIEFGRKVLFHDDRPSFNELESHVKGKKK